MEGRGKNNPSLLPRLLKWPSGALQVNNAVEYVQEGTTHLVKAKQLQKSTRKWMFCCIILLIVIICAIVGIVLGVTLPNHG